MKYFFDTEFIEGFHKSFFGKRRHHIDLISIGIVAEDGREYYAISNEYDYRDADQWVKDNVILPLYISKVNGDARNQMDVHNFHKYVGKSNERIKLEILEFMGCWRDQFQWKIKDYNVPEVYAYYADYDWVVFCSLFGRMIDLPKGFPMYCRDLKQMLDESFQLNIEGVNYIKEEVEVNKKYPPVSQLRYILHDDEIKKHPDYPTQENEHSAIDDARWNKKLYEFLQTI